MGSGLIGLFLRFFRIPGASRSLDDLYCHIRGLQRIYAEIDGATRTFAKKSALSCPGGCGHCCANSNVEATVFEILPLAEDLFRRGEIDAWWKKAEVLNFSGRCIFYIVQGADKDQGRCAFYAWRPLICRMFGYSGNKDRHGRNRLVACHVMKRWAPERVEGALERVSSGAISPPVMADVIMKMSGLSPELTCESMPINLAFKKAVERVWLSHQFSA